MERKRVNKKLHMNKRMSACAGLYEDLRRGVRKNVRGWGVCAIERAVSISLRGVFHDVKII